jgi:hypothetical protein
MDSCQGLMSVFYGQKIWVGKKLNKSEGRLANKMGNFSRP